MSRPLIPRPSSIEGEPNLPLATQKPKKISTACNACKLRKTRCTGKQPCEACSQRNSNCLYDVASDQRRKIANQRNVHDLAEAQNNLDRHRQLLGGIIATLRAGDMIAVQDLIAQVRTGIELSQLAAHVRNACRTDPAVEEAYAAIQFDIEGSEELPSPTQLLTSGMPSRNATATGSVSSNSTDIQAPNTLPDGSGNSNRTGY